MKNLLLLIISLCIGCPLSAQYFEGVEDKQIMEYDGMEVRYRITNKKDIKIKGKSFDRYEVLLTTTNKSGCNLYEFIDQSRPLIYTEPPVIAEFNCLNATGKKLTSKQATLNMLVHSVGYKYQVENDEGKKIDKTGYVDAGYYFGNGERIESSIILIVPDGEKPEMDCRIGTL